MTSMCTRMITFLAIVLVVGCTDGDTDSPSGGPQGLVELRVDATQSLAASITHVTVAAAGESEDLSLNPTTGTFDGSLSLPPGMQVLVARAFSNETLVGQSMPTPVQVETGVVTRVMMRILDVTPGSPPVYGPLFDSLSFPTTTQIGIPATFAISVIAPAGDPVTYSWTSDCANSTFSAQAATTTWSNPAEGSCTIQVVATSNGISITKNFIIVVFPAGAENGVVIVNGTFVTRPLLQLGLRDCAIFPDEAGGGRSNASCPSTFASPEAAPYQVNIFSWGGGAPGTLDVSASCGGSFDPQIHDPNMAIGRWTPPIAGGLCFFTARAVNGDGLAGQLSVALIVRPGMPRMP
jgi:hypothetical protein